jgi:nitrogen fixation protein FixH
MAQTLINAQHQVNLATVASFSNEVKENQYTAAQCFIKCYYTGKLQPGLMSKSSLTAEMP